MEYNNVIEHIQKAKVLVEVVQEGQNGLTARTLEAMFFNTKLITNNIEIRNFDFYNHNNIFIIGEDSNDRLDKFLHTPFQIIEKKALYPYEANGWIDNFTKKN